MLIEDTVSVAVLLPPVPPGSKNPLPPPAPLTSTWADVTPAGGVQVPEPTVQVTVIVVVPDSMQVPVGLAPAGADAARNPTATAIADSPVRAEKPRRIVRSTVPRNTVPSLPLALWRPAS